MISKKEVEHIADLARIGLTEKEKEKFAKDLENILKYVDKLNELNLKDIAPTSHVVDLASVARADECLNNLTNDQKIKLLKSAPHLEEEYIKIKEVFKDYKHK